MSQFLFSFLFGPPKKQNEFIQADVIVTCSQSVLEDARIAGHRVFSIFDTCWPQNKVNRPLGPKTDGKAPGRIISSR